MWGEAYETPESAALTDAINRYNVEQTGRTEFYPRFDYERFGTLEEYPPGHSKQFFRKSLLPPEEANPTDRARPRLMLSRREAGRRGL